MYYKYFWLRQVAAVRQGGWRTLFQKAAAGSRVIFGQIVLGVGVLVTAPAVLLVVCVKPFVIIRFGILGSSRIGHFSIDTEAYLCAKDAPYWGAPFYDIIGINSSVCNSQLHAMWARTMRITPGGWLWQLLGVSCCYWTRANLHKIDFCQSISCHTDWIAASTTNPHVEFSADEVRRGKDLLQALGIPEGASWVCIHNRDSSYLEQTFNIGPWLYHNFRDFSVSSLVLAARTLATRGYYVVRMGKVVSERMEFEGPQIIDYASSEARCDFADMYLLAKCGFYLGSDAGLMVVPMMFRRPVAFVNYPVVRELLIAQYWNSTPFLIKRMRWVGSGKFLSLRELFLCGFDDFWHSQSYEAAGVELIGATPEEVCDLAIEVDDRLGGRWVGTVEDEALQDEFWHIMRDLVPSFSVGYIHARIGAAFLRKHQYLLG